MTSKLIVSRESSFHSLRMDVGSIYGADRRSFIGADRASCVAMFASCCLQTDETITQAQSTISSSSTPAAQVSARSGHVTSSPVVRTTKTRASDVAVTSSQVLEDAYDDALIGSSQTQ